MPNRPEASSRPARLRLSMAQTQRTVNFFFRLEIGENFWGREAAIFAMQNSLEYDSIAN